MHAFPWYFELLIDATIILLSWQTWMVLAVAVVGYIFWKKRKKSVDSN